MFAITSQLALPDQIMLVGYFLLMLGVGFYFFRYMKGMKEYFTGSNRIPWWLAGVSFYMSSFSVAAFIQYSALAYKYGYVAVTLYWMTVPATLFAVVFFAKRWRRARIDSPVEYLETRYSPVVRQVFAWQGIPVRIIDDALKLVAIGAFISPILGYDNWVSILGAGGIILLYTFGGGLWAVTVTDFLQFLVMAVAIVVLLPLSINRLGGGFDAGRLLPTGFSDLIHGDYNGLYLIYMVFLFTLVYGGTNWALIQRYYCVPRERDVYKVGALVMALNVITPPLMFLPAMWARQWLATAVEDKFIYPTVCQELLPVGMLGLVLAAMFAATMSMLSSDYNVCASVLTNDVYRRLVNPHASQRRLVWIGRLMTLIVGAIALVVALCIGDIGGEGLFKTMVTLFSVATAPVAIPMLVGLISRRVTQTAALSGFLAGFFAGVSLLQFCPEKISIAGVVVVRETMILASTTVVTTLWMLAVMRRDRHLPAERGRVASFMTRLDVPIGQSEEDRLVLAEKRVFSPFRVVGIATLAIAALMCLTAFFVQDAWARRFDFGIAGILMATGLVMSIGSLWRRRIGEDQV